MVSNTKIAEMMYDVSELVLTLGPSDMFKTMQRVLLDMVSPAYLTKEEQNARAISPLKTHAASTNAIPATSHNTKRHARRKMGLNARTPALWPYRRASYAAVTHTHERSPAKQHGFSQPGSFLVSSVTNAAGTRPYKLYVPSGYRGQALPLVVMLHGCKQDPDDFASGTRMNAMAEEKQCFVLYPAQTKSASRLKCWNWFKTTNQQRDCGEPSLIADMVKQVMREYRIDQSRVYIGGLSAGGAMAVIMARSYPDLFAAAAVHSGVAYHAANNSYSALVTMKHGPRLSPKMAAMEANKQAQLPNVPIIVFHGDADSVVHPKNGDHVVRQIIPIRVEDESQKEVGTSNTLSVIEGKLPEGRAYTRTLHRDEEGRLIAEQWVIHGSGHAWSGGSDNGSHTDPLGPDATGEMMRFFYKHVKQEPLEHMA
jgi:poly(hydroxyalkanoate) depolymerase family esterase